MMQFHRLTFYVKSVFLRFIAITSFDYMQGVIVFLWLGINPQANQERKENLFHNYIHVHLKTQQQSLIVLYFLFWFF